MSQTLRFPFFVVQFCTTLNDEMCMVSGLAFVTVFLRHHVAVLVVGDLLAVKFNELFLVITSKASLRQFMQIL